MELERAEPRGARVLPDGNRMWDRNAEGRKQYSAVCGYINGSPGDMSREEMVDKFAEFGDIVAVHARLAADRDKAPYYYEGIGYVQFRDPESLARCKEEYREENHFGIGVFKDTIHWGKRIFFAAGSLHEGIRHQARGRGLESSLG